MNVGELIEELSNLNPEMEVILQRDAEGNSYSPLYCMGLGYYIPETTYSGEVYDVDYTADDCCMEESEWEELKASTPQSLILAPTN